MPAPDSESEILEAARRGDDEQLWALLEGYQQRLRRMVDIRLHPRLRGRVDPSDVIQESLMEISARIPSYLEGSDLPFYLWARLITGQKLMQFHRRHLDAQRRDVRRELRIAESGAPAASSMVMARALVGKELTPSQVAVRKEEEERLGAALEELSESDREILVLRHFEDLRNVDVARLLDIPTSTASQRYLRALEQLSAILDALRDAGPG